MFEFLLRRFVRGYEDVKDPAVRERYGTFSGAVGILLNLVVSLGKFGAGVLTGAVSVTADAFNNLSDAATSLVTLVGFRLSGRRANDDHPYGYGRIEYLAGLGVSAAILMVGFELAKGGVEKILRPEAVDFSWLSVGILLFSIAVKLWMYFFNKDLGRRISSASLAATAADSLSDCIATGAVLAGLLVGRFADVSIDGWVGVLVAAFVLKAGWEAASDTISPLLGQAPDPELVQGIQETVLARPEILGVHDMMVHDYGPGRVLASLHAEVSLDGDMAATHDVIDDVEQEIYRKFRVLTTIHMDPIANNDMRVSSVRDEVAALVKELDPDITIHDFRMTEGPTHTNLIFDVVLPRSSKLTDDQVRSEIIRLAGEKNPRYRAVIQVDHPFV